EVEGPGGLWRIECGADGLLASKPGAMDSLTRLGLEPQVLRGGRAPRVAFLATPRGSGVALRPIPMSLFRFQRRSILDLMGSSLLTPRAKLRLLAEPFVPRPEGAGTVADFATRRFGPEV